MMFAIPAFAQEAPKPDNSQPAQAAPAQDQAATPATDDKAPGVQEEPQGAATTAQATPQPTQPATPAEASPAATASAAPTEQPGAQPAAETASAAPAAAPATSQEQVAQAVGRDFSGYDKDADGKLSKTEFADWMGSLRKAAEPGFQPGSAEATTWASQAFTNADTDKNAAVNKQELTVFLTPKQPG
ncbi:hypothetical protein [Sphingomonas kyeonggiensis]|uniref:Putative component of type VI protein secretion system n=1 Tax=Sphingomonas kyeonggiensis TaxID=1268553 RepID=A0A7W6JRS9_9SPHN|nr:hypothetical protein [Sphingomonas kyeonggiensis]MBB4098399.1 putative component of type VI protein secretion system [Sphingomonas kyeonggiensis]